MLSGPIQRQPFLILVNPDINIGEKAVSNLTYTVIRTLFELNLLNNAPGGVILQRMPINYNMKANLDGIVPLIGRLPCDHSQPLGSLHCSNGGDVPETALLVKKMVDF